MNWFSQKLFAKKIRNIQFNSKTINKEIMIESANSDRVYSNIFGLKLGIMKLDTLKLVCKKL